MKDKKITMDKLNQYLSHIRQEEKSLATQEKYERDIKKFIGYADGRSVNKELVMEYKEHLKGDYTTSSINSMLIPLNGIFKYYEWNDCQVKLIRTQKRIFCAESEELSKQEYLRLIKAAGQPGRERINLILQTICGTGIRVSELPYITVKAAKNGQAVVECKGKSRLVFLPHKLQRLLKQYARKRGIVEGSLFVTRNGKPVNRSNIWKEMKRLCADAGVEPGKVFPHNLRHLFAKTYYQLEKDIARLAAILGHSSIETTRIYVMTSGREYYRQIAQLGLVV